MTVTPDSPRASGLRADRPGWWRRSAAAHPIRLLLAIAIPFVWLSQLASVLAGVDLMPAKLAELIVLIALAVAITRATGGRPGVTRLFAGLIRWRLGWRYLPVIVAMPLLTVAVAWAMGTGPVPADGWTSTGLRYLAFLALGAVTANLWEETVWSGFVQSRLMTRHGLVAGSLLTAVPYFAIHLPLAFEAQGWRGTTPRDALITWGVLLVAAPFQRYLIGTLLLDTGGSTLAAGLLHASINAAGAMAVASGGWEVVPALVLLTAAVAGQRALRGRWPTRGPAPDPTPSSPARDRPVEV